MVVLATFNKLRLFGDERRLSIESYLRYNNKIKYCYTYKDFHPEGVKDK